MTLERQEVAKTFQDKGGIWIPFRFKKQDKLQCPVVCEIKVKYGWKEYGEGTSEIVALRNAKQKWNEQNHPEQPSVGKLTSITKVDK